jgi:hypothetical protein
MLQNAKCGRECANIDLCTGGRITDWCKYSGKKYNICHGPTISFLNIYNKEMFTP